jgi:hypothetical protein
MEIAMKRVWIAALLAGAAAVVWAQAGQLTLRDIEDKKPRTLSRDEVTQLLPGAKMMRMTPTGSRHDWTNEADGSFIISSDNAGSTNPMWNGRPATARGKWHVSDDGRYCVLIEWKGVPAEEWCRFVLSTSDGYYMARTTNVGTERAFRFDIKK